ncbi:MAG: rRNA maturation RNase YbeY [Bacteroidota bacterium]
MISFHVIDVKRPRFNSLTFKSSLKALIKHEGLSLGNINLILCSDEYLLDINQRFLDHDFYTDIVTFDYCVNSVVSGDLYISIDRVRDNASQLGVNFLNEFARVCAHGVLHLCGYKDKLPHEELVMREKESFYLSLFFVPRGT